MILNGRYDARPMRLCLRCGQDTPHVDSDQGTTCDVPGCGAVQRWGRDLEVDDRFGDTA